MIRKIKSLLLFGVLALFLASCTQSKTVCGSKNDHKKRTSSSRKMAPSMMGGR